MKKLILILALAICYFAGFSQKTGSYTDPRDGKVYKTIKIGAQWIMAENFAYKPSGGNYWAYNNDINNVAKYGYLYDWETAKTVSPDGWHLPTDEEWLTLFEILGNNEKKVFAAIKENGTTGFNLSFGGRRLVDGKYILENERADFWSSNPEDENHAWNFYCKASNSQANVACGVRTFGFSVRLFSDITDEEVVLSPEDSLLKTTLKKMSLCYYDLLAGSNSAAVLGVAGAIYDANKNNKDRSYFDSLRTELLHVAEVVLKNNMVIQSIPAENLTYPQTDKPLPADVLAKDNDIFACLSVKTSLGVAFGMDKKVNMLTVWEITNSTGNKVKIKTISESRHGQGVFPDTGNPELLPVWIDLAKKNGKQFIEQLTVIMKKDKNMQ